MDGLITDLCLVGALLMLIVGGWAGLAWLAGVSIETYRDGGGQ